MPDGSASGSFQGSRGCRDRRTVVSSTTVSQRYWRPSSITGCITGGDIQRSTCIGTFCTGAALPRSGRSQDQQSTVPTPAIRRSAIALALAKVLLDSGTSLETISALVSLAPTLNRSLLHFEYGTLLQPTAHRPAEYLAATRHWAGVDLAIGPALEYLGAARAASRLESELDAWNILSQRTEGAIRVPIDLAQARTRLFDFGTSSPLLPSRTVESRVLNLEASRPGCDPRRRSQSLREFIPLLDPPDAAIAEVLIAFNRLAAGHSEDALESFKVAIASDPKNLGAWARPAPRGAAMSRFGVDR